MTAPQSASDPTHERSARVNDLLLPIVKGVGSERSYELLICRPADSRWIRLPAGLPDRAVHQGREDRQPCTRAPRRSRPWTCTSARSSVTSGDALGYLLGQIREFAAGEAGNGRLKAERAALARAADDVEAIVTAMGGFLAASIERPAEIYRVGLNATRLLMALGDLIIGWLLARQAEIALARLDEAVAGLPSARSSRVSSSAAGATRWDAADRAFYTGKIAAARFFAATVLPRLATERQIAEETNLDLMELPEEAF